MTIWGSDDSEMSDDVQDHADFGRDDPIDIGTTEHTGFASPADPWLDQRIDLNRYLIRHPAATFFFRVDGMAMRQSGIFDGDLLVVDRSIAANFGHIIIVAWQGELLVRHLIRRQGLVFLAADDPLILPIGLGQADDAANLIADHVWGVVSAVIHQCYRPAANPTKIGDDGNPRRNGVYGHE